MPFEIEQRINHLHILLSRKKHDYTTNVTRDLKAPIKLILGCPRKLGSMVGKWVITYSGWWFQPI